MPGHCYLSIALVTWHCHIVGVVVMHSCGWAIKQWQEEVVVSGGDAVDIGGCQG